MNEDIHAAPSRVRHLIVVTLLVLCIAATGVLLYNPEIVAPADLPDLASVDEIVRSELTEFNIKNSQITERSAGVSGAFNRTIMTISVPSEFSKTFLHSELAHKLHGLGVATPSTVNMQDDQMNIHLYWRNTVVRTLELRTSSSVSRPQSPGVILFLADEFPTESVLKRVAQMGDPIRLVLMSDDTDVILSWIQRYPRTMKPPLITLDYGTEVSKLSDAKFDRYTADITRIRKQASNASLILFESGGELLERRVPRIRRTGIHLASADQPLWVPTLIERDAFKATLKSFVYASRAGERPVLVIPATPELIGWLKEDLINYKKGGLTLAEPEFLL